MPEAVSSGRGFLSASRHTSIPRRRAILGSALSFAALCLTATAVSAQSPGLQPGEAYLTRFSGVASGPSGPMIDTAGTVGSIVDIRRPGFPPQGAHWPDEPQRAPVTSGEVGQVFGVVLDNASPPSIYLAATAAFGLHTLAGTGQWMPGMWGQGSPGMIWKLDAATGYRPQPFAEVKLGGRSNTGAALGNLAFDKTTRQIYVSDLETGMIHRFDAATGAELGVWDHGTSGRASFIDGATGKPANLSPIVFDPASRAMIADCAAGPFDKTPACWNLAASGRRVWGLGVRLAPGSTARRLYYAVWSGPGGAGWESLPDPEKRSAVWSVALGPDGGFVAGDVRREFTLPDFFDKPEDVASAGFSRPVSDITFDECASRPVMLVSERGGHRNLGLGEPQAFSFPHQARSLRYEMDQAGNWRPVGRYDIGYYDRQKDGTPFMRANCAGGGAFGYGYKADFSEIDRNAPGEFVWITGDSLCSAEAPCRMPGTQGAAQPASAEAAGADGSEVHGLQGMAEAAVDALVPNGAYSAYPANGEPYPAIGPDQSWLIDADINVDANGKPIEAEFLRDDATRIGDVAIYAICNPPKAPRATELLPVIPAAPLGVVTVIEGHDRVLTHATIASHGATSSHFRVASHNPWYSHDRLRSHNRWRSHDVVMSRPLHRPIGSVHRPYGSMHRPIGSVHFPRGSIHLPRGSIHVPRGSFHQPPGSIHLPRGSIHKPLGSIHQPLGSVHLPRGSVTLHRPPGSIQLHRPPGSIQLHRPPGSVILHKPVGSKPLHVPLGSVTHRPLGSVVHRPPGSVSLHKPVGSRPMHVPVGSVVHRPAGSVVIHRPPGSVVVHRPAGSVVVHRPIGSVQVHRPVGSVQVHRPVGSVQVHRPLGSVQVHRPAGSVVHRAPGPNNPGPVNRRLQLPQGMSGVEVR